MSRNYFIGKTERRRAMRLASANGAIWAVGNGLTSLNLIIYLALELGAEGIAISLILASPAMVGLLRLAAPALIARSGNRKRFCLITYLMSNLLLVALPLISAPAVLPNKSLSLAALVVIWSSSHLLGYLGTVSLWSWLGDVAPRRIRGRFIGTRERWVLWGRIFGMLASGLFTYYWVKSYPLDIRWVGYAIPATLGALVMIVSLVPLMQMPAIPLASPAAKPLTAIGQTFAALVDPLFRRLIIFSCLFAMANGLSQAAQGIYPKRILHLHLFVLLGFQIFMRLGQSALSPTVGRLADRFGNRPVMIVSQLLVALGPLFYLLATPEQSWPLAGAYLIWISYVGLNVCLPNVMLRLSPGENSPPYIAVYFAIGGAVYGMSILAGGSLFNWLDQHQITLTLGSWRLDAYQAMFCLGWLLRTLAAAWLVFLIDRRTRYMHITQPPA